MSGAQEAFQRKLQSIGPPFKPENVQIVKNGEVVGPKGIDDYDSFMQFLMLASIASYFADRTSEGLIESYPLTVTPTVTRVKLDYPAQALYIINDGLSPIFIKVNQRHKTPTQLNNGEDMFVDFETHKLTGFWHYCAAGGAATARAFTKR